MRALQAELQEIFEFAPETLTINSKIVKYDVNLDEGSISAARTKPLQPGNRGAFQLDTRTSPSRSDARQTLRQYLEGLSPDSLRRAYENNPLLGEQFPDLKP